MYYIIERNKNENLETVKNNKTSKTTKEYLANRFSSETERKVQQWLVDDDSSEEQEQGSLEYWNALKTNSDSKTYSALKRVSAKVGIPQRKWTIPLRRRLLRVAAVIIPAIIFAGSAYYITQKEQIVQVFTANGETQHVILPDSSEVWLNAGSNIQYNSNFKGDSRNISLEGEAYFSVRKNTSRPFVVKTNSITVNVLGTEFNVKAYANDSKTIATLDFGEIKVITASNQTEILEPNEQLTYNNVTSDVSVHKINANDAPAWRNGQLIFINAPFDEILQTLERRFNLSFEAEKIETSKEGYTIKFMKNDSIDSILNILEEVVGGFSYQIEKDKIKIICL